MNTGRATRAIGIFFIATLILAGCSHWYCFVYEIGPKEPTHDFAEWNMLDPLPGWSIGIKLSVVWQGNYRPTYEDISDSLITFYLHYGKWRQEDWKETELFVDSIVVGVPNAKGEYTVLFVDNVKEKETRGSSEYRESTKVVFQGAPRKVLLLVHYTTVNNEDGSEKADLLEQELNFKVKSKTMLPLR